MKRYALGIFGGTPAMFEQPDGDYVKWSDVELMARHLERPDDGWTLNTLLAAVRSAEAIALATGQQGGA